MRLLLMKTGRLGNMINEGETFVYPTRLPPLLKFDRSRFMSFRKLPITRQSRAKMQLYRESSLRESTAKTLRRDIADAYIAIE